MTTETAGAIPLQGTGRLVGSGSIRPQRRVKEAQGRAGFGMTLPFLVLFALFFAGPLVYSVVLSLRSPLTGGFSGLLNYRTVFHNGEYWSGRTTEYTNGPAKNRAKRTRKGRVMPNPARPCTSFTRRWGLMDPLATSRPVP